MSDVQNLEKYFIKSMYTDGSTEGKYVQAQSAAEALRLAPTYFDMKTKRSGFLGMSKSYASPLSYSIRAPVEGIFGFLTDCEQTLEGLISRLGLSNDSLEETDRGFMYLIDGIRPREFRDLPSLT